MLRVVLLPFLFAYWCTLTYALFGFMSFAILLSITITVIESCARFEFAKASWSGLDMLCELTGDILILPLAMAHKYMKGGLK